MPGERGRRGGRARGSTAVVVVKDSRAVAALVAVVVLLALAQKLVLYLHSVTGQFTNLRPVFDVVAVLVACVAGDRIGNARVLGWTSIGALLLWALARLVPAIDLGAGLIVLAEASLVGGIPLTVLIAQDLRWVSRALITGLVFGLRYWSEYLAIIVVGIGIADGDVSGRSTTNRDFVVLAAAILMAAGYLAVRVFDRLTAVVVTGGDPATSGGVAD